MPKSSIGIIPAAGKATRFGGLFKELLPLPDGRSLLEHAIERVAFCDRIVVVTNSHKFMAHSDVIKDKKVEFINQQGHELWDAIRTAYNHYDADRYYFTMPDTYVRDNVFKSAPSDSFGMGYFLTNEPKRFGILHEGTVIDKFDAPERPAVAWGVLTWAKHICDLWNERRVEDYTQAINVAIANNDWGKWPIGKYYDCADMPRYMEMLWDLKQI